MRVIDLLIIKISIDIFKHPFHVSVSTDLIFFLFITKCLPRGSQNNWANNEVDSGKNPSVLLTGIPNTKDTAVFMPATQIELSKFSTTSLT